MAMRVEEMLNMKLSGHSYAAIARQAGISRQAVQHRLSRHVPRSVVPAEPSMPDLSGMPWHSQVASWLQYERRSQVWLARQVRVSRFHLNRCIKGHLAPSWSLLWRIQGVMNFYRRNGDDTFDLLGTWRPDENPEGR